MPNDQIWQRTSHLRSAISVLISRVRTADGPVPDQRLAITLATKVLLEEQSNTPRFVIIPEDGDHISLLPDSRDIVLLRVGVLRQLTIQLSTIISKAMFEKISVIGCGLYGKVPLWKKNYTL
jgi:hypothetical protein